MCKSPRAARPLVVIYSMVGFVVSAACGQPDHGGIAAATAKPNAAVLQDNSLVLSGRIFPLGQPRCLTMDHAVLIDAKTQAGEDIIVDAAGDKLESLVFEADGVKYFWEPSSTGGAPDPVFVRDGNTYIVNGRIKQLDDYTKFSDFAVRLTCPN